MGTLTRSGIELAAFLQEARISPASVTVTIEFANAEDEYRAMIALMSEFPTFAPSTPNFTLVGVPYKIRVISFLVPGLAHQ